LGSEAEEWVYDRTRIGKSGFAGYSEISFLKKHRPFRGRTEPAMKRAGFWVGQDEDAAKTGEKPKFGGKSENARAVSLGSGLC
jgi:hypothetical protein